MRPSLSRRDHWRTGSILLAVLLLLGFSHPAAAAGAGQDDPAATPEPTPVAIEGAPVVVNGQELFRLQTRVGSITATERAALVSDHISRLANNPFSG